MSDIAETAVDTDTPPNPIYKHIPDPIEDIGPEENLREATNEIRRRDAGVDDRAPIYAWESKDFEAGEHEAPARQAKRAAESMTDTRKTEFGKEYLRSFGVEADDATSYAVGDEAARFGRMPSELPFTKITPVRDGGVPVMPLRDDQPITEDVSFKNLSEAKRAMQNIRALQDVEREELLNQFQQRQEQAQQAEQPQPEPQKPVAQPQPVTQPEDPLAAERAALQRDRAVAALNAEYTKMTFAERQAADAVVAWDNYARKQPELADNRVLANTVERAKRGDQVARARLGELHKAHQAREAWNQRYESANEARVTREIQLAQHHQQAQRAAYDQAKDAADKAFNDWLKTNHPQFAEGSRG
jgi:hypothetical protein